MICTIVCYNIIFSIPSWSGLGRLSRVIPRITLYEHAAVTVWKDVFQLCAYCTLRMEGLLSQNMVALIGDRSLYVPAVPRSLDLPVATRSPQPSLSFVLQLVTSLTVRMRETTTRLRSTGCW
jgi:hypothetical protein